MSQTLLADEKSKYKTKTQSYKKINHDKIQQINFLSKLAKECDAVLSETSHKSTAQYSQTDENVGIIFWYQHPQTGQVEILTGMETNYLTDKVVPEVKHFIEKYQIATATAATTTTAEARCQIIDVFSERAKRLSAELKIKVYFDNPLEIAANVWHVQYRVIGEYPKWGIIKGSVEVKETNMEAIRREIDEELFPHPQPHAPLKMQTKLKPTNTQARLNRDTLHTFHYQLSLEEKEYIEAHVFQLSRIHYGELVKYKFQNIDEYIPQPHRLKAVFNGKTQRYIQEFIKTLVR